MFFMIYNNKTKLMDINELIATVKNKIETKITIQDMDIEDKVFCTRIIKGIKKASFI